MLDPTELSVTPGTPLDAATIARYAGAGVNRLVVLLRVRTLAELERFTRDHAPGLVHGEG